MPAGDGSDASDQPDRYVSTDHLPPAARAALLDFPRQALHAASLGFRHPVTGEALRFETLMPADMAGLISALDTQP